MAGRKPKGKKAGKARRKVKTWEWAVFAAVGAAVAWGVWDWQRSGAAEKDFVTLAKEGAPALSRVEQQPSAGAGHVGPGDPVSYDSRFPTSGRHDPVPVNPGVYDTVQPPSKLVHSLEHGMVVVYYDQPGADTMATLKDWAGLFNDVWSGVVVTPAPGLGKAVMLTAWTHTLRLDPFEPDTAAAFIDRFRGRGPENPVR